MHIYVNMCICVMCVFVVRVCVCVRVCACACVRACVRVIGSYLRRGGGHQGGGCG